MRKYRRAAFVPLLLLLTAASPAELARWKEQARNVTIIRDDWGIAHVHGKTDADAVFAKLKSLKSADQSDGG